METIELDVTRIFVKVIQNGSFSRAALLLKLPKSTVSKAVSRLEQQTGTKLILRTTRSLSLTAAGRAFYEAALGPIQALEDAQKSLYGQDSILHGKLKITASEDLGTYVIAPSIATLTLQNPGLSFELEYTDEVKDLVKDGFDLAVRIGKVAESGFKVKRVGEIVLVLVASPSYLKKSDKISEPQDLQSHVCVSYNSQPFIEHWALRSNKSSQKVSINAKIASNQMTSLLQVALSGCGVALLPHYLCQPGIESGKLVRVLPDWSIPGMPVSVITPLAPSSSARLKITTEYLTEALRKTLSV